MSNEPVSEMLRWWLRQSSTEESSLNPQLRRILHLGVQGALDLEPKHLQRIARKFGDPEHPPGVSPDLEKNTFEDGDHVFDPSNGLGVGHYRGTVEDKAKTIVDVEYFHAPGDMRLRQVPMDNIVGTHLSEQTRCYVEGEEDWIPGRIKRYRSEGDEYEVDFLEEDRSFVPASDIYVRWAKPLEDPTEMLAAKQHGTVFFRSQRLPYVRRMLRQRAASQGYAGLLSSNVELYPHQVEIVRRILQDPVQRYLLADEVGLGKTIEAGIILRQYLLDAGREATAIIAVPSSLKHQWRSELESKFGVGSLSGSVRIVSLRTLPDLADASAPGMLIVDEAHRVAQWSSDSGGEYQRRFDNVRRLAHGAERLLLLSATPAHREERTFLAMLHLIDPAMYSLDDLSSFRKRLEKREDVQRFLLELQGEDDSDWLQWTAEDLIEAFTDDDHLIELCKGLLEILDADPVDSEARDEQVHLIQVHLRETYRVHQRMLRSRRNRIRSSLDTTRTNEQENERSLIEQYDLDGRREDLHDLIEEWRLSAVRTLDRRADSDIGRYARLYELLTQTAASNLEAFRRVIRRRLQTKEVGSNRKLDWGEEDLVEDRDGASTFDLSAEEEESTTAPLLDEEVALLHEMAVVAGQGTAEGELDRPILLHQILDQSLEADEQAVVFASRTETAERLAQRLSEQAETRDAVACHVRLMSEEERNDELWRFHNEASCQVLITDESGEEGQNFQKAGLLVHYDLPWDPNRIEQRIGRVDRIGRGEKPLQTHVLLGPVGDEDVSTPHEAWHRILKEGLGVYESSIASLQFLVDRLAPKIREHLFLDGTSDVDKIIEEVQERAKEEMKRIEEEDSLDAVAAYEDEARRFYEEVAELDSPEMVSKIRRDVEGWVKKALHFYRRSEKKGVVEYEENIKGKTLVPRDQILNKLMPALRRPMSYHRSVAARLDDVDLLRPGHPFLDAISELLHWDDRGRAYAIWREVPSWPSDGSREWAGFRFDFIVEADRTPIEDVLADTNRTDVNAILRRADRFLPPRVKTVFVDPDGEQPPRWVRKALQDEPQKRENGGIDTNLTKDRRPVIHDYIGKLKWESRCRQSRSNAEDLLRGSDTFQQRIRLALQNLRSTTRERIERLRIRTDSALTARSNQRYEDQVAFEQRIGDALERSLESPLLRLDSIGFIVASGCSLRDHRRSRRAETG